MFRKYVVSTLSLSFKPELHEIRYGVFEGNQQEAKSDIKRKEIFY